MEGAQLLVEGDRSPLDLVVEEHSQSPILIAPHTGDDPASPANSNSQPTLHPVEDGNDGGSSDEVDNVDNSPPMEGGDGEGDNGPIEVVENELLNTACPPPLPNLAKEYLERLKSRQQPEGEEEDDDFRPVKKRKVAETSNTDESEMQTCSICFEPWSNSGSHRIASLKCGHLFGLVCIEKWLRNTGGGKCPQCNCKAKRGDIRVIYAKAIAVLDTTERDAAVKALQEEKQLRIQAMRDEAQALLGQNLARSECDRLKEEIERLRSTLSVYTSGSGTEQASSVESLPASVAPSAEDEPVAPVRKAGGRYSLLNSIHISQNASARVMAYDADNEMLVVSKRSIDHSNLRNGLAKLSTVDLRHSEYVGVHSEAGTIRDTSFRPRGDGVLLTAAIDKTAKLTSLQSNTVVQSFDLGSPVWACGWDQDDPNYLYCGLQSGSVAVYDIRSPSEQVGCLTRGKCPVTSLAAVPKNNSSSTFYCGGLLMGSLGGCMFWEKSNSCMTDFKPHVLQTLPEGPCPSVSFDPSTRHGFASFRPTRRAPRGKHMLFQLHNVPTHKPVSCQPIQHFFGGSTQRLLSRSNLFVRPNSQDELLAAYGDEGMKTVHICDISSTEELQVLALPQEAALDLVPFSAEESAHNLAVLTQSKLLIYGWR